MKTFKVVALLAVAAFVFAGCSQKKVTTEPYAKAQQQVNSESKAAQESGKNAPGQNGVNSESLKQENTAKAETVPQKAEETVKGGDFADIHFSFDKYDLSADSKAELKGLADWLDKNNGTKLKIEGNCDERGTAEYNLALGDKRARAAMNYLAALGVSGMRIETVSNGKEKPLCEDHTEACWARNRRDHFDFVKAE
ncbi:MAG: OmpA family protein [Nitrospiraceae bacterium]|nr:OmpA family protein [Nitrospiraceae bacterium]